MTDLPTIYVCGNAETILSGSEIETGDIIADEAVAEYVRAACDLIDDSGIATSKVDNAFRNWNGGKHYTAGQTIGRQRFGYRCGSVAIHAVDSSQELCDLCDKAATAANDALYAYIAECGDVDA